jgi:hypothetical protein
LRRWCTPSSSAPNSRCRRTARSWPRRILGEDGKPRLACVT